MVVVVPAALLPFSLSLHFFNRAPDHTPPRRSLSLNTMMGHLNKMTPKVDSDQTLPQERANYDPNTTSEVVVDAWITLWALVHSLPRGLRAPVPRGLVTCGGA